MSLLERLASTPADGDSATTAREVRVQPVLIKRYRNRRLYDTGRSAYITLDDLASDLAAGKRIKVVDSDTGEDLTRRTLVQVLLTDAHVAKLNHLPEDFLLVLIQLEDHSLMRLFGYYLNLHLSSFAVAQRAMKENLELMRRLAPSPADMLGSLGRLLRPKAAPDPKGAPDLQAAPEPQAAPPPPAEEP